MNVLFDLDGTLTDSRQGIVACIKHALSRLGQPSPPEAELERFIGPSLRDAFRELLPAQSDTGAIDAAVAAYRERFTALGMFENSVYEGIQPVLESFAARGARLFVATSKPRVFAQRILEHFGLAERFEAVYGSELDGRLADKGDLIAHALYASGLAPADTVMIGDRRHDVLGALENRVFPVGVLWGYGSREELTLAGARKLLAQPRELEDLAASR